MVGVACSGGPDSTALLQVTAEQAAALGLRVVALHVHHGLQPEAEAWVGQVEAQVAGLVGQGLPVGLAVHRVPDRPPPGASVEAWARAVRRQALAALARTAGCDLVLLAHHREDQAETVLLQVLRGAGVPGLAAMPRVQVREGITWARPWLGHPRATLQALLAARGLQGVHDPSNADPRFARNRLRLRIWPELLQGWPGAAHALADTAAWAGEAMANLADLAALDGAGVVAADGTLDLAAWRGLPDARARNLVRHWWRATTGRWPSAAQLGQVDRRWRMGDGRPWRGLAGRAFVLECLGGRARLVASVPGSAGPGPAPPAGCPTEVTITGPGLLPLAGWGGTLAVTQATEDGLPATPVTLRLVSRAGGERFALGPGRPARALKKQFQALGIASWQRTGPLLWRADGALAFVPGLGVDARCRAQPGVPQWRLAWHGAVPFPR